MRLLITSTIIALLVSNIIFINFMIKKTPEDNRISQTSKLIRINSGQEEFRNTGGTGYITHEVNKDGQVVEKFNPSMITDYENPTNENDL